MSTVREPGRIRTWTISPEDLHAKLGREPYERRMRPGMFLLGYRVKPSSILRRDSRLSIELRGRNVFW